MAPMHRLVGVLYNKNMGFHDKIDFTAPITLCFIASKGHLQLFTSAMLLGYFNKTTNRPLTKCTHGNPDIYQSLHQRVAAELPHSFCVRLHLFFTVYVPKPHVLFLYMNVLPV